MCFFGHRLRGGKSPESVPLFAEKMRYGTQKLKTERVE